ncbi:MAG: V-type ATP synthase subunit F [Firmicutes bacterium]|nr:V-type ATP synthase subunit F [Bacillota bacterium]
MNINSKRIAVLGDKNSVFAFRALGCETLVVFSAADVEGAVKRLVKEECPVILITEEYAEKIDGTLQKLKNRTLPVIIPIPSLNSPNNKYALEGLKKSVERAIGADIIFNKEEQRKENQ